MPDQTAVKSKRHHYPLPALLAPASNQAPGPVAFRPVWFFGCG